jgi:hypothetical protein
MQSPSRFAQNRGKESDTRGNARPDRPSAVCTICRGVFFPGQAKRGPNKTRVKRFGKKHAVSGIPRKEGEARRADSRKKHMSFTEAVDDRVSTSEKQGKSTYGADAAYGESKTRNRTEGVPGIWHPLPADESLDTKKRTYDRERGVSKRTLDRNRTDRYNSLAGNIKHGFAQTTEKRKTKGEHGDMSLIIILQTPRAVYVASDTRSTHEHTNKEGVKVCTHNDNFRKIGEVPHCNLAVVSAGMNIFGGKTAAEITSETDPRPYLGDNALHEHVAFAVSGKMRPFMEDGDSSRIYVTGFCEGNAKTVLCEVTADKINLRVTEGLPKKPFAFISGDTWATGLTEMFRVDDMREDDALPRLRNYMERIIEISKLLNRDKATVGGKVEILKLTPEGREWV